ncbi:MULTISPECIES: ABC transporter substrate-binding protein [unclassified Marinobacterium]|jgi:branched-chain amino acid transport system substrate-binding protein|uniref:ABC transporter substrate-binding protein n=1 Tax=unclassified Marinobacterium TaxID=2644139 RepID=UPI00156A647D|nr:MULTISPECIES: ABC transporter substrate-binding protein [unclassified Marinobacterium]NRP27469.1 Leucine-, isoleucine-, valine-, threonine-, and alanine-binding protein precursor [Marinobacterium sp. xm-d-420]NRP52376.1 Leucine-, isoleucine-, valine-, threonine-, and alanine-binding protein precursor [Marinobacterium sp. xm-v-242]NRP76957.1 Leucine-, isoleucine-, valine-, threonine-, and alanine-binding protein precursor [Marinobacterium sp. xm-m-383]
MFKTMTLSAAVAIAASSMASADVRIASVAELSGAGAAAGAVWHDGLKMAYEEINASGGILGEQVDLVAYDSQTNPQNSRAMVQKAIDEGAYVLMGTVYSSSTVVNMLVAQQNGVPQITGSESPTITAKGNPYIFRTAFGAQKGMPKIGSYLKDGLGVKNIAVIWANTEFGKGGHDAFVKVAGNSGINVAVDLPTEQGQVDFAADVAKIKSSGVDAVFAYMTEEESARFLIEAQKQGLSVPIAGDTVLISQKVIDLSGGAANGAFGHVGLTAEAPVPAIQEMAAKFEAKYGYGADHNAIKGYLGAYTVKYVTEKIGEFDQEKFADTMHGLCLDVANHPGVLMDVCWDDSGEMSRASFLVEVVDGKQKITKELPAN